MKATILLLATALILPFSLRSADSPASHFIRDEGTYDIAPKMLLTISADPSGMLQYTFKRPYSTESATADVTFSDTLQTARGGPFLFYWDSASETLWYATANRIVAHAPKNSTTYDHTAKSLEHAPEAFRDEISRNFKQTKKDG